MSKGYQMMNRKVNGRIRQVSQESVVMEVPIPMAEILAGAGFVIEKIAEELGLMLMFAAMQAEAENLAGPKNRKDPNRKIYWWGQQSGYVYYEGKKVPVYRPRLREKGGNEVKLKTYEAFKSGHRAEGLCMADLLSGLSTRNYEWVAGRFLEGYGIKKSTVSRRYIRATKKKMQELLERDLRGLDLCVIFIDGIEIKGHLIVVALGIDMDGKKHVLGLWQGATENIEVCLGLLDDLERRGLDMDREYLFVIDGSKALRSAIRRKFGKRGLVQRCQVHKRRNVKGYLPPEHQASVDARIRAAYNMSSYEEAKESLERTVRYLERL
ncbi:MAG: IS256 family transposase, partial [Nitrospirae bacterium]